MSAHLRSVFEQRGRPYGRPHAGLIHLLQTRSWISARWRHDLDPHKKTSKKTLKNLTQISGHFSVSFPQFDAFEQLFYVDNGCLDGQIEVIGLDRLTR